VRTLVTLIAVGLLGWSSLASAEDMDMSKGGMDMTKSEPKSKADAEYGKGMTASMTKMMSNMDVKTTGNADQDFVLLMMPHHQGAIEMARVELRYGKDPVLRRMAQDIVSSQEKEIVEMREWQAKNGK
jgi:uncharacterized protein (DUF305 family)